MPTPFRRLGVASIAALPLALALALPSAASATTETEESSAEIPPRVERACLRIPNLTTRTENVIDRINGDADTRGSLLWLDGKIAQAEENGRDQLAEALQNRRAVREASVDVFELRLTELGDLAERCRSAGVDL